jgi:ABC-2 type transport system permease protein
MTAVDLAPSARTVLDLPEPPANALAKLRWAAVDGLTVAVRNLRHIRQVPDRLLNATVSPIMFVLLFAYVLGSAIAVPGSNYREFLMPGIFVQTVAFCCAATAMGVANDMSKGLIDRFRSLPMARSAVLVGRTSADLVEIMLGIVVMAACGLAVGWRIHAGFLSGLAGFALLVLFGFAMTWLGAIIGLLMRSPEAVQSLVFVTLFPITFVANTFVPTENMTPWLRNVADWNPISALVAGCRELFGNVGAPYTGSAWPLQHPVPAAFLYSLLLLALFAPLAVRRYRSAVGR